MRFTAYITSYGHESHTEQCVKDCLREAVDKIVVLDNGGDYTPIGPETVIKNVKNCGWLGAFNQCLMHATQRKRHSVILNNDVRLSYGFFKGLRSAFQHGWGIGIVVPAYNGVMSKGQAVGNINWKRYTPKSQVTILDYCDGTAMAFDWRAVREVGVFDPHFEPSGWGAEVDYTYRAANLGVKLAVTRMSYVQHVGAVTCAPLHGSHSKYMAICQAEVRSRMREKYGKAWTKIIPFTYGAA